MKLHWYGSQMEKAGTQRYWVGADYSNDPKIGYVFDFPRAAGKNPVCLTFCLLFRVMDKAKELKGVC